MEKRWSFYIAYIFVLKLTIPYYHITTHKAPLKGCYSEKTDKNYNCVAVLDDTGGQFVNFKAEFGGEKKQ